MSESKELLEATIKGLEEKLDSLNADLRSKQRELADVNKPTMTSEMFDKITELVEDAINNVNIDEDDLEYSMEFDYDNKVCLNDISLDNSDAFAEKVMCAIDGHYKIVETEDKE
jgi:hypothetical protein